MTDLQLTRRLALALLAILLVLGLVWPALWQLASVAYDASPLRESFIRAYLPKPQDASEHVDRLFFIFYCGLVGLVALAFACWQRAFGIARRLLSFPVDILLAAALVISLFWVEWVDQFSAQVRTVDPPFGVALRKEFTFLNPVTWVLAGAWMVALLSRVRGRGAGWIVAVCTALLVASFTLVANRDGIIASYHLEPLLHAIVQVGQGAAVSLTTRSIYGFFPHFTEPWFAISGVSLVSFSLLYSAVTAIYILCCYGLLDRICNRLSLRLAGLFAIIYLAYFLNPRWPEDPYPQLFFVRFAFPAVLMALVLFHRRLATLGVHGLLLWSGVFTLGIWWNLESGAATFVAFAAIYFFSAFDLRGDKAAFRHRLLRDCGTILVGFMAANLAFVAYFRLRYGAVPDLYEALRYIKLYTGYGLTFGMWPLGSFLTPLPFAGLAFGGAVILAVWQAANHSAGNKGEILFAAAVLGLAAMTYWTGRTTTETLMSCGGPFLVVILASLVSWSLDRGAALLGNPIAIVSGILSAFAITFAAASFLVEFRSQWQFQYPQGTIVGETPWERQRGVLERVVANHPGPVFVASPIAHYLYETLGMREPIATSGYRHDAWKQDFEDLLSYVRSGQSAVVALHLDSRDVHRFQFAGEDEIARLVAALSQHYRLEQRVDADGPEDFRIYVRR